MLTRSLTIRLELSVAEQALSGRLVDEAAGTETPFSGWLDLVAAIDAAVTNALPTPDDTEVSP